jgi:hypothetical protein
MNILVINGNTTQATFPPLQAGLQGHLQKR